jgi:hypothetical protein
MKSDISDFYTVSRKNEVVKPPRGPPLEGRLRGAASLGRDHQNLAGLRVASCIVIAAS